MIFGSRSTLPLPSGILGSNPSRSSFAARFSFCHSHHSTVQRTAIIENEINRSPLVAFERSMLRDEFREFEHKLSSFPRGVAYFSLLSGSNLLKATLDVKIVLKQGRRRSRERVTFVRRRSLDRSGNIHRLSSDSVLCAPAF